MISSERFRPSMQITIADVFQDFNDPRKQQLAKRVAVALEDQQKRLKSQLDSNNLSNLQVLLKKQQALKSLEEKIYQKDEEIQQIKQLNNILTIKVEQLQKELMKRTEMTNHTQQKVKNLTGSLKHLESVMKSRQSLQETLMRQKQKLAKENDQLQTDKQKYQKIITNLRQTYSKKMEETEYVLKIKQKQMAEQFNQNLSQIVTKNAQQKQRKEVDRILRPQKNETKTQRIQCDLINSSSQSSPRKRHDLKLQDSAAQTDQSEGKLITQIIVKNQKVKQHHQNLQEVRLMYTKTPMIQSSKKTPTPKVTTYTNVFKQQKKIQTDPEQIKNPCQSIQVNLRVEDSQLKQQIQKYKQKLAAAQQFHEHRYAQLKQKYEQRKQQINKIQNYKLEIMQLKLQIQKAEYTFNKQRQILTNINQKLQIQQNQLMLRKFSSKLESPVPKNKCSKTCSLFYPKTKRIDHRSQISVIDPEQKRNPEQNNSIKIQEQDKFLSPRKWQDQQVDIITVIKQSNKLKYFSQKRRSVTEQTRNNTLNSSSLIPIRKYQKYSNLKRP